MPSDNQLAQERAVKFIIDNIDDKNLHLLLDNCHHHLSYLENRLKVTLYSRGNRLQIEGTKEAVEKAKTVIQTIFQKQKDGLEIDMGEIDAAILLSTDYTGEEKKSLDNIEIQTKKKLIKPRTKKQAEYLKALQSSEMVFATGPAGTGKTYLAVAIAVAELMAGLKERIILSRPAIEAGEKLGFLPGDMKDKIDPYLRPLYDALYDMLPLQEIERRMIKGEIEVAPLAFMRGRTLKNAFIILDEAQNTTVTQMRMFLTRLGENSKMVIVGDLSQVDLEGNQKSGFIDAIQVLGGIEDIHNLKFRDKDVMRHQLVSKIVTAYESSDKKKSK